MTKTEQLLRELIAIPSVNPSLSSLGDPRAGEQRVGKLVASYLRKAGLEVTFAPVEKDRSNVIARLRPQGPVRTRILLAPHLDTVGPDSDSQFNPERRGNCLYGRGACDTKGSMAAMLTALREVAQSGRRPATTEIGFVGLVDEECHQAGSRAFGASGAKADLAIVGEPTRLQIVTAHKGVLWLRLHTRGKAAHGARPELGQNAVHLMSRIVDALETDYAAVLRRRRHTLLGRPTINVGSIHGGRQPNIVPDQCTISIDRRTLPGENNPTVMREIKTFLRHRGLAVRMEPTQAGPCPALETSERLPLVRQFLQLAGQKRPAGVDYFSDASVLAASGIPSVVFGPGDIAQAHTSDEWIDVRELEQAKVLLVCFLRALP